MKRKLSLNEASNQAIIRLLESYEDWIEDSKTPEERRQKLDYVEKVRAMFPGNEFGSTFGSNKKLRDQKIDSRESYGWIDQLSPEEKENELKDQKLKPQYDFHKNFMKSSNFNNPRSTDLKVYVAVNTRNSDWFVKTDNINGILNKNEFNFKELSISKIDETSKLNDILLFLNSKGNIPNQIYYTKILNSNLLLKKSDHSQIRDSQILNSNIVCEKISSTDVKIENSSMKISSIVLEDCEIIDCNINIPSAYITIRTAGNRASLSNINLDKSTIRKVFPNYIEVNQVNIKQDVSFFGTIPNEGEYRKRESLSFDEFREKFSK